MRPALLGLSCFFFLGDTASIPMLSADANWELSRSKSNPSYIVPKTTANGINFHVTDSPAAKPSIGKSGGRCLYSGALIEFPYIRAEGQAGRLTADLISVASRRQRSTLYAAPTARDSEVAKSIRNMELPGIDLPTAALGFRVQQYGFKNFLDLFTPRQILSLSTFAQLVSDIHGEIVRDAVAAGMANDLRSLEESGSGARAYADAVVAVLGLCIGKNLPTFPGTL